MEQPIIAQREVTQYILAKFNLRAKKQLGQNFLVSEKVVRNIVAAADVSADDLVLEIGPGIGTLTQALAQTGAQVKAVELDRSLLPVLATTLAGYENISIINDDILKVNIPELMEQKSFTVAANLPYYITTPIIFALLEQHLPLKKLVMMMQKEVAERIVAKPGGKDYGALSVSLQYYMEPHLAFKVPPGAFIPSPQVESAVVVCTPHATPPVHVNEKIFFQVVKAAFSVRRKMLSNALKNMGLDGSSVKAWLSAAQIDGTRRGETLSIEEFGQLSNIYEELYK